MSAFDPKRTSLALKNETRRRTVREQWEQVDFRTATLKSAQGAKLVS